MNTAISAALTIKTPAARRAPALEILRARWELANNMGLAHGNSNTLPATIQSSPWDTRNTSTGFGVWEKSSQVLN